MLHIKTGRFSCILNNDNFDFFCLFWTGYDVVLVSSGAVGIGCQRMKLDERPTELAKKQALAAIGQVHLMRFYEDLFRASGLVSSYS